MPLEVAATASDKNPAFLSNKELSPFLRFAGTNNIHCFVFILFIYRNSDCSQVSDGASALIVVSEKGLKDLGIPQSQAIEVLTVAHTTGNLYEDSDPTQLETTKAAADLAYRSTGLSPCQMQIAEVHDCFGIAECEMYEALGFAPYGQAIEFIKAGHTQINGKIPVNTGGGLIGFGHPVGATGVKQVLEVYRQMKGLCGAYQVPRRPEYGITANMGGSDKTAVVSILKNL
jgi:acetyl-CoA acyltransferase